MKYELMIQVDNKRLASGEFAYTVYSASSPPKPLQTGSSSIPDTIKLQSEAVVSGTIDLIRKDGLYRSLADFDDHVEDSYVSTFSLDCWLFANVIAKQIGWATQWYIKPSRRGSHCDMDTDRYNDKDDYTTLMYIDFALQYSSTCRVRPITLLQCHGSSASCAN